VPATSLQQQGVGELLIISARSSFLCNKSMMTGRVSWQRVAVAMHSQQVCRCCVFLAVYCLRVLLFAWNRFKRCVVGGGGVFVHFHCCSCCHVLSTHKHSDTGCGGVIWLLFTSHAAQHICVSTTVVAMAQADWSFCILDIWMGMKSEVTEGNLSSSRIQGHALMPLGGCRMTCWLMLFLFPPVRLASALSVSGSP
jgi:hypothetical protein